MYFKANVTKVNMEIKCAFRFHVVIFFLLTETSGIVTAATDSFWDTFGIGGVALAFGICFLICFCFWCNRLPNARETEVQAPHSGNTTGQGSLQTNHNTTYQAQILNQVSPLSEVSVITHGNTNSLSGLRHNDQANFELFTRRHLYPDDPPRYELQHTDMEHLHDDPPPPYSSAKPPPYPGVRQN